MISDKLYEIFNKLNNDIDEKYYYFGILTLLSLLPIILLSMIIDIIIFPIELLIFCKKRKEVKK